MSSRCFVCKKKVGLDYYECNQCDTPKKFCSDHRFPFAHCCVNDSFELHKERLIKNNPKIQNEKIQTI
jgi:hypothetical protein